MLIIADKINDILPQTQCRQCGFSGCRPYAEAIAQGDADINQCPPGGTAGIANIASLLGCAPKPLNTSHGQTKPKMLAVIDESTCIGCTLCIEACPVDAILGARQQMHTVINDECTGCELCIAPCPVDCISMALLLPDAQVSPEGHSNASCVRDTRPFMDSAGYPKRPHYRVPEAIPEHIQQKAFAARARYEARLQRLERDKAERAARHQQKAALAHPALAALAHPCAEKAALTKSRSLP